MSALRVVGSGLGCALFAGLGAFVGASVGEAQAGLPATREERAVGGAILGSATGALLIGMLAANSGSKAEQEAIATAVAAKLPALTNPRFP